ncbi:lipopolysaccharide assembly protein LapA domain-containing protein [Novosphingobium sp. PhB55]|jgi:uncharacterized integral membrane protein|uniref:lipopolysaccharide assembly protein LapA domain-containing protein n=1 Tax=unclassified Novosphingobium TaxID=2644732 RepID=UPI001064E181|nr:LapA family protein [Novosphingobium sp. PhB55]TDW62947.1 uncharacterized protein DUF1049 [Novosphingobium sp. PhB55]
MNIVRTVLWIAITAILVAFIAMNWTRVPVNFWPLDDANYVHFEWPVGVVALVFFVLGMAPVWLYLRAVRWRLQRRIASLENSLRANSVPSTVPAVPESAQGAHLFTPEPTSPSKSSPEL